MYQADYRVCVAKVLHAAELLQALERELNNEFAAKDNRPRVGIKYKPDTGEHVAYISYMPELEDLRIRAGLLVGDIVHNLRSALDHLTLQLALRNTDGNVEFERRVQFPIEDSSDMFKKRCTDVGPGGWLAEVHPSDWAVIEEFQPYGSYKEGQLMALIRDLSNADKHRLLIDLTVPARHFEDASVILGMFFEHAMRQSRQGANRFRPEMDAIEAGAELFGAVIPNYPETNMDVAGYIVPIAVFREFGPPPIIVVKALGRACETVMSAVKDLGRVSFHFVGLPSQPDDDSTLPSRG